jgi:hypothetical protein
VPAEKGAWLVVIAVHVWRAMGVELFLQMDKGASRLNQAFEIIRVFILCFQPKLFEHIVRFVAASRSNNETAVEPSCDISRGVVGVSPSAGPLNGKSSGLWSWRA